MLPKNRTTRATTAPAEGSEAEKAVHTPPTFTHDDPDPHADDAYNEDDLSPSEVKRSPGGRRATRGDISRLAKKVTDYIETDAKEHREIRDDLSAGLKELTNKVESGFTTRDAKLDVFGAQLSTVVTQSAVTAAHTERLVAVVDSRAQAELRIDTVKKETAVKDDANAKQFKRELTIKILGWMTPIAVVAIGGIVALIEKCR